MKLQPRGTVRSTLAACALLALFITACARAPDADSRLVPPGPDPEAAMAAGVEVALPAAPALGLLEDWSPPEDCAPGKMPVVGQRECQWLATPCPDSPEGTTAWPADLPEGALRFVSPGGTGDGLTKRTPMGSIQLAVNAVPAGGTVVLSTGRFVENVAIHREVNLQGVCARDTILEADGAIPAVAWDDLGDDDPTTHSWDAEFWADAYVLLLAGPSTSAIADLQVTGDRIGILATQHALEVRGVWIKETKISGFNAYVGSLHAEGLAVTGIRSSHVHAEAGSPYAYGEGIMLEQVPDPVVQRTSSLRRVWIRNTGTDGLQLFGSRDGTPGMLQYSLEDIVSEGAGQDAYGGTGLAIGRGTAQLARLYIRNVRGDAGLRCHGCTLTGAQVVIQDSTAVSGLHVHDGDNADEGASVSLSDVRIQDISPATALRGPLEGDTLKFGFGARLSGGALTLQRAEIERTTSAGLVAYAAENSCGGEGARPCGDAGLQLEDVKVTGTRPDPLGRMGMGLAAVDGARVTALRLLADENHGAGVLVVDDPAHLDATGPDRSRSSLQDITVTNTRLSLGADDMESGDGIALVNGAAVTVERFALRDNARVGLLVGGTSDGHQDSAFFKDGQITGHAIGVSVAYGWMDLERDLDNVRSFDNQIDLSSSETNLPGMGPLP